jgi:hypothetical protein
MNTGSAIINTSLCASTMLALSHSSLPLNMAARIPANRELGELLTCTSMTVHSYWGI